MTQLVRGRRTTVLLCYLPVRQSRKTGSPFYRCTFGYTVRCVAGCYGFTLLSKFFINGASVGLYIQTDTNVEANIDRIRRGWNNRQEGVENAHKTPVLLKGAKLENTGGTH